VSGLKVFLLVVTYDAANVRAGHDRVIGATPGPRLRLARDRRDPCQPRCARHRRM